jgi:membrane dipeptidase
LEQIDVSINLIEKYSEDFQLCRTADDVEDAIRAGKVASLFGLEGYVFLTPKLEADIKCSFPWKLTWRLAILLIPPRGQSELMLVLRMFHQLGVRYMTLTHGCNNAFADSGGIFELPEPKWNGLSYVPSDTSFLETADQQVI